jgi:hypothetical protein
VGKSSVLSSVRRALAAACSSIPVAESGRNPAGRSSGRFSATGRSTAQRSAAPRVVDSDDSEGSGSSEEELPRFVPAWASRAVGGAPLRASVVKRVHVVRALLADTLAELSADKVMEVLPLELR